MTSSPDFPCTTYRPELAEWQALIQHRDDVKDVHLNDLFKDDPERFNALHLKYDGVMLDYSKQPVTQTTLDKLFDLAQACDLEDWRAQMFSGKRINITEDRAVLHTALRSPSDEPLLVEGVDIRPIIRATQEKINTFSDDIRDSKRFSHVVNIGIGGSDLGSAMVYEGLKPFTDRDISLHFVSNVDATHLSEALRVIDPERTLFIVTSKSFSTEETMTNARSARDWLTEKLGKEEAHSRFVAVTQNVERAKAFGVDADSIFPLWDWVGGRYSLWSAVGLPLCIALGSKQFGELLAGAHSMDQHFLNAPLEQNMPVILGMLGVWHRNFLDRDTHCISPYDQYLQHFAAYMQQVDMESNGKSVDRENKVVDYGTGPIIFGEVGTNAQHAFFQLFHQGATIVPCDIIITATPQHELGDHHQKLVVNALAQSKAFMEGRTHEDQKMVFEGNRPTNTIVLSELTPYALGSLLALYEHKIFVQGIIWNINSFDQCGVELGKILARSILSDLESGGPGHGGDCSTQGLLDYLKELQS